MATSTRLFQGRVVADSDEKKGESLLASTPVVVLRRFWAEHRIWMSISPGQVEGIDLDQLRTSCLVGAGAGS